MFPVDYLVAAMLAFVPLEQCPSEYASVEYYEGIAADMLVAASVNPVYSEEEGGEVRTALLMASIASYESHFDDEAVSRTHDVCIMQVRPREGDDVSDRQKCLDIALDRIHESFKACSRGKRELLSVYTTGKCYFQQKDARYRRIRSDNWWETHPFQPSDESGELECGGLCSQDQMSVCVSISQMSPEMSS